MSTVKDTYASVQTFTITLASLASSTAGVGRQSTLYDNTTTRYRSMLVFPNIKMGTSPTANTPVYIYLIRSNNDGTPIADDSAGTTDAGITIVNAPLLGVLNNPTTTTGNVLRAVFDTAPLGPLGPKFGFAIVQSSGVALDSTGGNHSLTGIGITNDVS